MAYLSISPLHATFRQPQPDSSNAVSKAILQLSCELSLLTYAAAYVLFGLSNDLYARAKRIIRRNAAVELGATESREKDPVTK